MRFILSVLALVGLAGLADACPLTSFYAAPQAQATVTYSAAPCALSLASVQTTYTTTSYALAPAVSYAPVAFDPGYSLGYSAGFSSFGYAGFNRFGSGFNYFGSGFNGLNRFGSRFGSGGGFRFGVGGGFAAAPAPSLFINNRLGPFGGLRSQTIIRR